jgi:hypothetical protein
MYVPPQRVVSLGFLDKNLPLLPMHLGAEFNQFTMRQKYFGTFFGGRGGERKGSRAF